MTTSVRPDFWRNVSIRFSRAPRVRASFLEFAKRKSDVPRALSHPSKRAMRGIEGMIFGFPVRLGFW